MDKQKYKERRDLKWESSFKDRGEPIDEKIREGCLRWFRIKKVRWFKCREQKKSRRQKNNINGSTYQKIILIEVVQLRKYERVWLWIK